MVVVGVVSLILFRSPMAILILCRPNTHTLSHLCQPCLSSYTTHQKNWIVCPCPYRDIWSWKGNKVPLTFLRGTTSRIKNIPLNLDADHKTKSCVPHYFYFFFVINGYIIGQVTQLTNQLLYRSLLIDYVLSSVTYWIMNIHNENVHCCLLVILDLYFVHTSFQMSSR